uniref:Shieldin complex subunit 2 C-terminal domain-containing protein n=1 Tax=Gorilla gorilla gorilla TaxID=9595 RepID=A0A2I2ZM43_GORGO
NYLWWPGAEAYACNPSTVGGYIWEFKYLFVQCNYTLENLELHTTPWSSCECLFDDDIRAITFKAKFQKSAPSFVKISDLATHLEDKCSGKIFIYINSVVCCLLFCRPALMTAVDGRHDVCIRVESKLIEKILLNISADCLNRVIVPSSEITYGMVVADLFHSLLAVSAEPCVLKIQSLFVLDENSYPLQQDFSLLDFYPDIVKHGTNARL